MRRETVTALDPVDPRPTRRGRTRLALALALVVGVVAAALGPASPAAAEQCPPAFEQPFTDVPLSNPFCREIAAAKQEGITTGYPDGSFGPTQVITRQQAAVMLWNAANEGFAVPAPCLDAPFTDVPQDHPFCGYIRDATEVGVFNGYADGTFRPTDPITRGAAAATLFRFPDGPPGVTFCVGDPYPDVPQVHPFCGEISTLTGSGAIDGYPDGTFRPANPVSRQAFVAMLVRWMAAPS